MKRADSVLVCHLPHVTSHTMMAQVLVDMQLQHHLALQHRHASAIAVIASRFELELTRQRAICSRQHVVDAGKHTQVTG